MNFITGLHLTRDNLKKAGVGALIDKIFGEVIEKLQDMQLDRAEWGCIRAVMLFSPGMFCFRILFFKLHVFKNYASIKLFYRCKK